MTTEIARRVYNMLARGVVEGSDDERGMQTVKLSLLRDEAKMDVERMQNYGFSSHVPGDSEVLVCFLGGGRDHGVVVAVDSRNARFTGLSEGEVAIYSDEGDSIVLKRGRIIDLLTEQFNAKVENEGDFNVEAGYITLKGENTAAIEAPDILLDGDVVITGGLQAGSISAPPIQPATQERATPGGVLHISSPDLIVFDAPRITGLPTSEGGGSTPVGVMTINPGFGIVVTGSAPVVTVAVDPAVIGEPGGGGGEGGTGGRLSGEIIDFAGDDVPVGWYLCDGAEKYRLADAPLFAAIGTKYGEGDGETTFNLPDLRGRVTAMRDLGAGRLTSIADEVGAAGGAQTHTLAEWEMPYHGHGVGDPGHQHGANYGNSFLTPNTGDGNWMPISYGDATWIYYTGGTDFRATGIWIGAAGGNYPHANVQPTLVMNKLIKR